MSSKGLVSRWNDALVKDSVQQLRSGVAATPFGLLDSGRNDLRGMPIHEILRKVNLEGIDLSHCKMLRAGQFIRCKALDVAFVKASLITNVDGEFTDCDFGQCKLTGATLRGSFRGCSFEQANLRSASATGVVFEDCSFAEADLTSAHLLQCAFIRCRWDGARFGQGSLGRSVFTGLRPQDVGDTIMDHVQFEDMSA